MNYIIVDLEATCWNEKGIKRQNEIIEIGAAKVNEQGDVESEFCTFVKPKLFPMLSEFCSELTTINQSDIDGARAFPEALTDFQQWIGMDEPFYLCSWGLHDKSQFQKDCRLHGISKEWLQHHISVKHQYAEIKPLKRPTGMKGALAIEKIEMEGTHHRGIDDAKNIAKIFVKYLGQWKFE